MPHGLPARPRKMTNEPTEKYTHWQTRVLTRLIRNTRLGRYVDQVCRGASSALHVGQSKRRNRLNVGQPLELKQDLPKCAKSNTITGEEERLYGKQTESTFYPAIVTQLSALPRTRLYRGCVGTRSSDRARLG